MKSKYIVITATCLFLIVLGLTYTYSYKKDHGQEIILSSNDMNEENSKAGANDANSLHMVDNLQLKDQEEQVSMDEEAQELLIYVHICGAIINPDVYQVEAGTRVIDLIDAAGGLTSEAADDYINQAVIVEDGQRIYIPTRNELFELSVDEYVLGDNFGKADNVGNKVNINTADETELMSLPGIGQAKAKSIIEYRKKNGGFKANDDLMNISGIKERLFSQIEDMITVK